MLPLRFVAQWIVLPVFIAMADVTQAADMPAAAPRIGSGAWTFEQLKPVPTAVGVFRRVADNPTATFDRFECHVTVLNPGCASHPPHRHPQEEVIILQRGTLDVSANGEVQRVGPGSVLFFASNEPHNVTNVGTEPATYFVFNLTTGVTRHFTADTQPTDWPAKALHSTVFDWDKLTVKATRTGERRDIVDSPTRTWANLEAHVTTLRAGEIPHPPHHHPDEEIILVKEGTLEATIGGKTYRGGPGAIFFYSSNEQHGMKNVGGTTATYYVLRVVTEATPKPAA